MKTSSIIALALVPLISATACNYLQVENEGGKETGGGRTFRQQEIIDFPPGIYLTAVSYEDGYDWRRDTAYGQVRGTVNLYRDTSMVLSIPAGLGEEVSLDPDKHHFIEGHLYTEYSSGSETVIKCDGSEIFRYQGAETLKGMMVRDDDVYTLGQNTGGRGGFSFRKNGEILVSKETGTVWGDFANPFGSGSGALYEDRGVMFFSFYTSYKEDSPLAQKRFYLVKNQTISELWFEEDVKVLYDMRMIGGVYTRIVGVGDESAPRVCLDEEVSSFSSLKTHKGCDGFFLYEVDGMCYIFGRYKDYSSAGGYYTRKWSLSSQAGVFDGLITALCMDGEDMVMVFDNGKGLLSIKTVNGWKKLGYFNGFLPSKCFECSSGQYYLIRNPGPGEDFFPQLVMEKESFGYEINGMLTSVSILR